MICGTGNPQHKILSIACRRHIRGKDIRREVDRIQTTTPIDDNILSGASPKEILVAAFTAAQRIVPGQAVDPVGHVRPLYLLVPRRAGHFDSTREEFAIRQHRAIGKLVTSHRVCAERVGRIECVEPDPLPACADL